MSFKSPYPDVEIPELSLPDFIFGDIDPADLDRPALIDGASGVATTYRTLIEQVHAIAGGLTAVGLRPGDVVGLHSVNLPAFAAAYHGILRAGGVVTTVNALYTAEDVTNQLRDGRAKFLFTNTALLPQAQRAAAAAGIPAERVYVLDPPDDGVPSLRSLIAQNSPAPELADDSAEQLAVLPYSSGTTSKPKGVMLTHRNMVANVCQVNSVIGIDAADKILAVLPFFHVYGMTMLLNTALRKRACLVTMPKFDLHEFLATVSRHRCTYMFIAPPIAVALAKHPAVNDHDLSSVRVIFSGAAPLDRALGQAVAQRLGCRVRQGYGMSEMSPVSHVIPADRDDIDLGSVGLTIPNMECKLVDPATGEEIAVPTERTSDMGELWCRGPNVMAGYLNNEQATADAVDAEGYLHTGDIATVDADGVVTIVDRVKELIKYKGYQVAPAELEALLLTHPQVRDAAVIGAISDDGEEVPKALVVRADEDNSLDETAVMKFVGDRVSPHKKIRIVDFIDEIPKSATGKILRKELRAMGAIRGASTTKESRDS